MRILVIISSALFLLSCSVTSGNNLKALDNINSQSDANRIIPKGMTKAQVRARLGQPAGTGVHGSITTWGYNKITDPFNAKSILFGAFGQTTLNTKSLSIQFSTAGRVIRTSYSEMNMAPVE